MGDWSCRYDEPARFTAAGFAASERSTDQVNAKATKPEQSNTKPATVTARKLLEANSSRMVHRLSCAPARTELPSRRTVKRISFRRPISIRVDVLVQHLFETEWGPASGKINDLKLRDRDRPGLKPSTRAVL
jgi:hypothetical protein